jgi:Fe2+ or Zn2+ uptake regulation protein
MGHLVKERTTLQKQIILKYLQETKTHPTAEMVYRAIKSQMPQISLSTVYRILRSFAHKGLIKEIALKEDHFDGDLKDHAHFVCQKCGKIYDLDLADLKIGKNLLNKSLAVGTIKNFNLIYYGICRSCLKKQSK